MNPHTKSPWIALPAGPNGGAMAFGPDFAPVPQTWANARLIAAAPELLDALQRFVNACDAHLPEPTHQAFCGLFASARTAIAKATGAA